MDLTIDEIKNPKLINKKITKIENIELNKIINKIERLMPGVIMFCSFYQW